MNNFNFGEILSRAWKIIWKHKVLWIFGILASCGRSSGNFNSNRGGGNGGRGGNLPPQVMQWFNWIEAHAVTVIVIFVTVLCVIWIIVAFLSTIGKIGLIRGVQQVEGGTENLIFGQLFSESMPYFWRMFGLSLILAIPVLIFVIIFVGAALLIIIPASQSNGSAAIGSMFALIPLLIGCLCIFVLLMFVLRLFFTQAERAIVLEDLSVMPALSRGWEVFTKNLGPILIMAIILGVLAFVVGLITVIPVILIVFPAAVAFAIGNARNATPVIFAGVCFCLYLPVLWVLSGILISYVETAWTLTYMRLTGHGPSNLAGLPTENLPEPPSDSNKTILAGSSNADAQPAAVSDPNKTVIGRAPDAESASEPDDNPSSELDDPNKTVLRRPPHA
jgi:hypothetical protein